MSSCSFQYCGGVTMVCVGGRYQLLGELGRGGTSTVFLAVDTVLHKQWAVKETLLQGDEEYQQHIIQSLRAEANVLKECDHPAIPRIVDFFEENGRAYAVRDYVKGRSLKSIVEESGLQNVEIVLDLGMQLCSILSYLHSHYPPIIYGDLKPSQVMISEDGTVCLIDFGAATQLYANGGVLDLRTIDQCDARFATNIFTAPEILNENSAATTSSDVYSIGMTLRYALLPTEVPKTNVQSAVLLPHENREVVEQLVSVLAIATATKPSHRYKDCDEMFSALEACEHTEKHSQQCDTSTNVLRRKQCKNSSKPRKKRYAITALIVVVLVFIVILFNCLGLFVGNAFVNRNKQSFNGEPSSKRIEAIRKNNKSYDSYMQLAERESNSDIACRYISHAMQVQNSMRNKKYISKMSFKPLQILLQIQLADQQWSVNEEQCFVGLINKYEQNLRPVNKDWSNISIEIGKAYWYYFAGFSGKVSQTERLSRMRVAKVWFQEAQKYEKDANETSSQTVETNSDDISHTVSNQKMLSAYIAISDAYAQLVDVSKDCASVERYKNYVNQLQQLMQIVEKDHGDVLFVDTGELVLQSIHSWLPMFLESGSSKQEIQQMCEKAEYLLKQAHVSNDEAVSRKKNAIDSVKKVQDEINLAFLQKK